MKEKQAPSIHQFSWNIEQAAVLSGRTYSDIIYRIKTGKLSPQRNEIIIERRKGARKSHYIITRPGMTVLSGIKFPDIDYIELAEAILKLRKMEAA